jgi:DNA (cytosine-5)-methyltransferase 1
MLQQSLFTTAATLTAADYPALLADENEGLIVDLFASGGGISTAIEMFFGRSPDLAVNHSYVAVNLHTANHPHTAHLCNDVRVVHPLLATGGRPVMLLHASPDCCHFSQAKGGQPRDKAIRALTWVVLEWAGIVRPAVITLENVEQIQDWGPLIAKRKNGRVVKLDGTLAARGERVPVEQQFLVPCRKPKKLGRCWRFFTNKLRSMGYVVEHENLRASDHGAGTTRERLFMVARCDGKPIGWPKPTHGKPPLRPVVRAADCIEFDLPILSIFERDRALADATMLRIARGLVRYVLKAARPFIVQTAHGERGRNGKPRWGSGVHSIDEPLPTITTSNSFALVQPKIWVPGEEGLNAVFLEQANSGMVGHSAEEPLSTIVGKGCTQRLIMAKLAGLELSNEQQVSADRVAAFLIQYYSEGGQWADLEQPLPVITTRDRLALVTVRIQNVPFIIVDVCMRMLTRWELARAQGFPANYILDRGADGKPITHSEAVHMIGNSVSPLPYVALLEANFTPKRHRGALAA